MAITLAPNGGRRARRRSLSLFCGLLSLLAGLQAADLPQEQLLHTANSTLAFQRKGDAWSLIYYGPRLGEAADIAALAPASSSSGDNPWRGVYPALPAFGQQAGPASMESRGALAVAHADGVLSLDLVATGLRVEQASADISHLIFELRDRVYPFQVTQHFRAIASSDVVETWLELRHEEATPVRLSRMASTCLVLPRMADQFSVLSLSGQWAAEAQVTESPLGLGQALQLGSRSGVRSAWANNPSFMVSLGGTATETEGVVIGGALAWSGAWEITLRRDHMNTLSITAGADNGEGAYVLEPGRTLVLPKMVFTYSKAGKGQVSRNFHRWAREVQMPRGRALRPILLNSWEGAYFKFNEQTLTDMMDGVRTVGGEMFVVDDGWFGRGKFARDDDKRGLGDWVVNEVKLPRGLPWLAEQAKQRGLAFGLWVEPEMANTTSELVTAHPDWVIREKTRPLRQGRGGTQVVLDFSNPAVREAIHAQLDTLVKGTPGLAYIKWDANADFMNIGSAHLPADRQANLWFDYAAGLYEVLGRLQSGHPELQLQACSSGGARMDYGVLKYADEFWTSDDTDARQRIFIQWGAGHFYPASAMAAHVTAVPNHQTHRSVPLKYRFDVAMSGRLGFELHPKDMSAEELAFAKTAVETYKRIRPVVQQGDLYRLVSPLGNSQAALMYVSEDQTRAVVFVYGLNRQVCADYYPTLRLQGLNAGHRYKVTELNKGKGAHSSLDGKTVGAEALMAIGVPYELGVEYDSLVLELEAVK